jgi:hypothetical protein
LNDDNTPNPETKTFKGTYKYVKVSAEDDWNDAYVYYYVEGVNKDGTDFYKRYHGEQTDAITNQIQLYVRQAAYLLDENDACGIYWAVAENRVANSALYAESSKVVYPHPKDVVITDKQQPEDKVFLGDDGATLTVSYNNNDGKVSYQWYYAANKALDFDGAEDDFDPLEDGTESTLIVTEEGHYKVKITNTRNGSSKSADSIISRVTLPAEIPNVKLKDDQTSDISEIIDGEGPSVSILENGIYSDSYSVIWYRYDTITDTCTQLYVDENIQKNEAGKLISVLKPTEEDLTHSIPGYGVKDENGNYILSSLMGVFYPVVYNFVNGKSASTENMFKDDMGNWDTNLMFYVQ